MLSILSRRISPIISRSLTKLPPFSKTYLPNEEWICGNNTKFGITSGAVEQMGEIVFLEYNCNPGDFLAKDTEMAIIESVKSVQVLNTPFDCLVMENNTNLEECLDTLNENPECEENSWIIKLEKQE